MGLGLHHCQDLSGIIKECPLGLIAAFPSILMTRPR
jgi:hypothetical protein